MTEVVHFRLILSSATVMDHIPSPSSPVCSPVVVPCLSNTSFDGLDFDSYPSRRGWDQARLLAGDFAQHSNQDTAAFLQDWLYFGVLAIVLGEVADKASYVKPEETCAYGRVDTTLLPQHLNDRLSYLKALVFDQPSLAIPLVQSAEKCLQRLSYLCCMASCHVDGGQPGGVVWPLLPEVDLSLRVLGQLLASCLYGALMTDYITGRLPRSTLPQLQFPSGNFLFPECTIWAGVRATYPWYPKNSRLQRCIMSA